MSGMKIGSTTVTKVYAGSVPIKSVYLGSTKLWSSYAPMTSAGVPSSVDMSAATSHSATVTATPVGGGPSYTYAWTKVSGNGAVNISSGASSATVTASDSTSGTSFTSHSAILRCTVNDGTTVKTGDCTVTFYGTL
jgi:hypothetical protein